MSLNYLHNPLMAGWVLIILSVLQFTAIILSGGAGVFIIISASAFLILGIQMLVKSRRRQGE